MLYLYYTTIIKIDSIWLVLQISLLCCAIFSLFAENPVYSILFLSATALCLSITFILLGAEFIGLMFSIVYIGAIVILFLFIVMLLTLDEFFAFTFKPLDFLLFALGSVLFAEFLITIFFQISQFFAYSPESSYLFIDSNNLLQLPQTSDQVGAIGTLLYMQYSWYVLLCGLLLLIILMGVVLLLKTYSERITHFQISSTKNVVLQVPTARIKSAQVK